MVSFFRRYSSGEHEEVWRELRALGPVPANLREDVAAVAEATMQRVAAHVARIAETLPELGFEPEGTIPMRTPPKDGDRQTVEEVEATSTSHRDELHKARVSGSTHDIILPDLTADPVIHGVDGREDITLVEYLRVSITWGGFPGWSFAPGPVPEVLTRLARRPDF